jgi:hypothetical protein
MKASSKNSIKSTTKMSGLFYIIFGLSLQTLGVGDSVLLKVLLLVGERALSNHET